MHASSPPAESRNQRYKDLVTELTSLVAGEPDLIANLANAAALLNQAMPQCSWVGFYIMRGDELVLGPFQGKVACVRIAMGRGVCGTAARDKRTIRVDNVDEVPGHIACDAGSKSEVVAPIIAADRVVAVLDVDSYEHAAFDAADAAVLDEVAAIAANFAWPS